MTDNIGLGASQRSSLLNLIHIDRLTERATLRLNSGRSVNSVADDAVSFFRSRELSDRAGNFQEYIADISLGASTINAAFEAVDTIDTLLKQLRFVTQNAAISTTIAERISATAQFSEILSQIGGVVSSSSLSNVNLLTSSVSSLSIRFSDNTASNLVAFSTNYLATNQFVAGLFDESDFGALQYAFLYGTNGALDKDYTFSYFGFTTAPGPGPFGAPPANSRGIRGAKGGFSLLDPSFHSASFNGVVATINAAIAKNQSTGATLGTDQFIVQTRLDFTQKYINQLESSANSLVAADLNEEGANLLSLQTRQRLSINSLTIFADSQASVLSLLRQ